MTTRAMETTLRDAMKSFATGVTVLTAGSAEPHGMTANAFNSVSLDPPMVLCCVSRNAGMHTAITTAGSFAVSILDSEQEDVARYFANRRRPAGLAQFAPLDWWPGEHTGAPLLGGCLAWLECDLAEVYGGGDHSIFLGEVRRAAWSTGRHALLFFGGGFHHVCGSRNGEPLRCCW